MAVRNPDKSGSAFALKREPSDMKPAFVSAGHFSPLSPASPSIVGTTAGIGGFALAANRGSAKQFAASYGPGFATFAVLALAVLAGVRAIRIRWRQDVTMPAGARA